MKMILPISHFMALPRDASGGNSEQGRGIVFRDGTWQFQGSKGAVELNQLIMECQANVTQLAEVLGMDPRGFRRLVFNSLGINPKEWLRRIRIVSAMKMLRRGIKIESAARDHGFRHASDFTHEFKSIVGVTPTVYVKAELSKMFPPHRKDFRDKCKG